MRYVLIVMFLFSASVQAEEWERIPGTEDMYFSASDSDLELNVANQTVLVKILMDKVDGVASFVNHIQFKCADGKPVKERRFYTIKYERSMGTGERTIIAADTPWIPFRALAVKQYVLILCELIDENQP